jgi:glycosyltransferase involved in cell wall biosynthesis
LKIGIIVPGFSSDERDWCIPAHLNLARSLASGHQVLVFTLRYPHRRDVYCVAGVMVHSFNGENSQGLSSAKLWATTLSAIRREHIKSRFDVLHSIYGGEAGFVAVIASRWLDIPAVVSLVGGELAGFKDIGYGQDLLWRQRLMNRFAVRFAQRVLCGSQRMTELARARVSALDGERIQTLPLGVDTDMFSPAHLKSIRPRGEKGNENCTPLGTSATKKGVNILNVGSLIPVKDHETLLRALAELARELPCAHLNIIGTGRLDSQLRRLSSDIEIDDRVQWVGAVAHDQLPDWYDRADLFVQSSMHEGEGMAVLEAAASGVALVGSDVGVLSDLAERGAAIVVPPRNATALAKAMRRALDSLDTLRTRAHGIVRSEYNLERTRERLLEVYSSA